MFEELKENCWNREEIERDTMDQSNCGKWLDLRSKLLTASNFGKVCRAKESSYPGYVKSILHSKFTSKETSYGINNESKAIQQMEKQLKIKIDRCGIFIDQNDWFLAASPDGLIGCNGLVEVKCPYSVRNLSPDSAVKSKKVPYLKMVNGEVELKKSHMYYYQIQGQLHIADRQYCMFGMWTAEEFDMLILRVERDYEFFKNNMQLTLSNFYNNHLLPEIIDSRFKRNMPIRKAIEKKETIKGIKSEINKKSI